MSEIYNIHDIFETYKRKVYRLSLSLSRNEADAEDITQNTFLKIIKNISKFQGKSKISTWIYRITVNEALQLRRRKRTVSKHFSDREEDKERVESGNAQTYVLSALPADEVISTELEKRLESAIDKMPLKYRVPLLLKEREDLSLEDSAGILGLKTNSLKTRLHRARESLKQALVRYENDKDELFDDAKKCTSCDVSIGFILNYAHNKIAKTDKKLFESTIQDCDECKEFFDKYKKALNYISRVQCDDLPDRLHDKIKSFLKKPAL